MLRKFIQTLRKMLNFDNGKLAAKLEMKTFDQNALKDH